MFLYQLISILLISITFYTYLANIVFSCDLGLQTTIHSTFSFSFLWSHSQVQLAGWLESDNW